jgi:hypothetical protein
LWSIELILLLHVAADLMKSLVAFPERDLACPDIVFAERP